MKKISLFVYAVLILSHVIFPVVAHSSDWSENFNDGVANDWQIVSGSWSVCQVNGQYSYCQTNTSNGGSETPHLAYYKGQQFGDFTASVDVKYTTGAGGGWDCFGIVYRYKDYKNYYWLFINPNYSSSKPANLIKVVNGVQTSVMQVATINSAAHNLRIEISGDHHIVKKDGVKIIDVYDNSHTSGYIGAATSKLSGSFDNFIVSPEGSTTKGRGMYIDDLAKILGNSIVEKRLLEFVQKNNMTYLSMYTRNEIDFDVPTDIEKLDAFIQLAKNSYGVKQIGLIGGCETKAARDGHATSFDKYLQYNDNPNNKGKIDVLNLECEFWNEEATYSDWWEALWYVNGLTKTRDILVEAYIGWPDKTEMLDIAGSGLVDRLFVHAYVKLPSQAYAYTKERINWAGESGTNLEIWPIFSAESSSLYGDPEAKGFMGDWFKERGKNNSKESMILAEDTYLNDYVFDLTSPYKDGVQILGFQYYSYRYLSDIYLTQITQ